MTSFKRRERAGPVLSRRGPLAPLLFVTLVSAVWGCSEATEAATPESSSRGAASDPAGERANAPAAQVAQAGPGKRVQLFVQDATSSSFLKNNWNRFAENYHPNYLFDDNPKTAWVEGADGNGEGEWVRFAITDVPTAQNVMLKIRNGYQKSKGLLAANAAPTKLELTAFYHGAEVAREPFTLSRKMGWQDMSLPLPPERGVDELRLRIVDTVNGSKYKDTCISDVEVFVTTHVRYKKSIEEKKQKQLLAWTKARRAEAIAFKKIPRTYPFAATTYSTNGEKTGKFKCKGCEHKGLLDGLDASAQKWVKRLDALEGGRRETMSKKKAPLPIPDGLFVLNAFIASSTLTAYQPGALVKLNDVAFFETKKKMMKLRGYDREMLTHEAEAAPKIKNPWVYRDAEGKILAVEIDAVEHEEGRESESVIHSVVTMLFDDERLVAVVKRITDDSVTTPEPMYDDQGRPKGPPPKAKKSTMHRVRVATVVWNAKKTKVVAVNEAAAWNHWDDPATAMTWTGTFQPAS